MDLKQDLENVQMSTLSDDNKQQINAESKATTNNMDNKNDQNPTMLITRSKRNNRINAMSFITSSFSIYKKRDDFFAIQQQTSNNNNNDNNGTQSTTTNNNKSKRFIELSLGLKYWNLYFRFPFILWAVWLTTGITSKVVYICYT